MGCGHVAPSCARRCAGSRLPDHARCSFFVRSRHHARVRPRRAIRLFAGSIWRALQHSHNHAWPRTTFSMGEQAADQERGRQRQRIPHATYDLRARLAQRRLRLGVHRAAGRPTASFGHNIVASMLPHPCLARHVALHLAAPCYAGPAPLCCALFRTPRKPNARPAHLAAFAWALCVCVCVGCVLCAVPVDMFLAFGSAVVRYPVASAFCCFVRCCTSVLGFGSDCSCSSLLAQPHSSTLCLLLCVVPVACGFACADACGSLSVVPPHHTTSIHHTPHHAISTHLIHHTPRIP